MLYLFDIDGTLVRSFMRDGGAIADYDRVEVLPGRREAIARLYREKSTCIALVTNQGGVALGYQTKQQAAQKITQVLVMAGISAGPIRVRPGAVIDETGFEMAPYLAPFMPSAYVSFGLPHATLPEYRVLDGDEWRKPGPGMLISAMRDWDHVRKDTVFVGDRDSDRQAATAADIAYVDAATFFEDGA
jgi:histidinol phosphatase-like enzyme